MFDVDKNRDINPEEYKSEAEAHQYIEELSEINSTDVDEFIKVGVDIRAVDRSGTFIQKDSSIIHCNSSRKGVEISGIGDALSRYDWLKDYFWKSISPDKDKFTKKTRETQHEGFFIRCSKDAVIEEPVQACLHIAKNGFSQNVHNVVIAEENSSIHISAPFKCRDCSSFSSSTVNSSSESIYF